MAATRTEAYLDMLELEPHWTIFACGFAKHRAFAGKQEQ